MRPVQRVARPLVIRLATAGHRATDRAGERDLVRLPARLDRIDGWIEQGLLDGAALNAADFQIAPSIASLLRFEQLAPFIEGRPAARLARRVAPDFPGSVPAVLPPAWLASLRGEGEGLSNTAPTAPRDVLQATAYDGAQSWVPLRQDAGALPSWRHGG